MSRTKQIILINALQYLSMGLSVNNHPFWAIIVLLSGTVLAGLILFRDSEKINGSGCCVALTICGLITLITGFSELVNCSLAIAVTACWLVVYNFSFPLLLQKVSERKKTLILNASNLLYIALMAMLLCGDLVIRVIFRGSGILPAFWFCSVIIGLPTVVSSLFMKGHGLLTACKSNLS